MKTFLLKFRFLAFVFLLANLFFANAAFSQPTVTTENRHGEPTTFLILTSGGFQSNYNQIIPLIKPSPS